MHRNPLRTESPFFLSFRMLCVLFTLLTIFSACGGGDSDGDTTPVGDEDAIEQEENVSAVDYDEPGPYLVGNSNLVLSYTPDGADEARELPVTIWYPAADSAKTAAETGQPIENFLSDSEEREQYATWLGEAPAPQGPTHRVYSALDAEPVADLDSWPVVAFSHCMNCIRFSTVSIAERLASYGIAVVAPDHVGGTMFENGALNEEFLKVRGADIAFVLDSVLDADNEAIPEKLRGKFDAERIGMYGHSYGAVTTGYMLMTDDRIKAGFLIAAPPESELIPGVELAKIHKPMFLVLAEEDGMITFLGNQYIRDNFANANPPVWKIEVEDAGHMSFTDICKLTENFPAGCGDGFQDITNDPITYIDIAIGKSIAQSYAAAYFGKYLLEEPSADLWLENAEPEEWVSIESRK